MKTTFLVLLGLFIITSNTHSQSFIGWTETQIREEMKDNPNATISVEYQGGKKNLIVIDESVTAQFEIDNNTGYCDKSGLQFRNTEVMNSVINGLNKNYQVLEKNKTWETILRGHKIRMELYYSEKLKSNMLISYQVN